jgi:3-carboxy-cis,cis-muconate cycloisomerase
VTDLFWPGDHRAGDLMSGNAFLSAMVTVEQAWLDVLVQHGVAPQSAGTDLFAAVDARDAERIAAASERDGSPVVALLELVRERTGGDPARWLHRGLTSQDVVDTALMLCLRTALSRIGADIKQQVTMLARLTGRHRDDPALARTLSQPALPSTVGAKIGRWLSGVLDAGDTLAAVLPVPLQLGGAVGTWAALTELTGSPEQARSLVDTMAHALELAPATPWHTNRVTVTHAADALVTCCDAWGHIAGDVITGSRWEVSEFAEANGGGSSAMPHKRNPILSVLIRRAALTAPALGAVLHAASADSVDERSTGGWHAEWAALRTLTRLAVVAAAQTSALLGSLSVTVDRARTNLAAAGDLLAEQRTMVTLTGALPRPEYTGAASQLIDAALARAQRYLAETAR